MDKKDRDTILGPDWIEKVASCPDMDVRAHMVALTYHTIAIDLDQRLHGAASVSTRLARNEPVTVSNANWFNFGTWATTTITRDMDVNRPPLLATGILPQSLRRRLTPAIVHLKASDGLRVSRALSWGQRLVFISTCYTYVGLRTLFDSDPDFEKNDRFTLNMPLTAKADARPIEEQITSLTGWKPQIDSPRVPHLLPKRHFSAIANAFELYRQARRDSWRLGDFPDAGGERPPQDLATVIMAVRAQRILLANVIITAVEQDVVNQAVGLVLDHVPSSWEQRTDARIAALGERYLGIPRQYTGLTLPFRDSYTRDFVEKAWARLMTHMVLVMALPTETLRLGKDIPPRDPSSPFVPAELREPPFTTEGDVGPADICQGDAPGWLGGWITGARSALLDLEGHVEAFDRSQGDGYGSAARDWRRYDERMNWAVNLLRSRQQDSTLFWRPYTEEDTKSILNEQMPRRSGTQALDVSVQPPPGYPDPFFTRRIG